MSSVIDESISATPPAVIGRIEICDPQTFEFFGLIADAFDLYRADERFVVFDLLDAMLCHSN